MEWNIKRYDKSREEEWNAFAGTARNATFLFQRGFMDYHSDRFSDHSLMAFRNGKLSALLPANIKDGILMSHHGLSYGGWILPERGPDTTELFGMWREWLAYCRDAGIRAVEYKPLPYIYAKSPSQEDLYLLALSGATLLEANVSTTIDLRHNPGFNKLQRRHLKEARTETYYNVHQSQDRTAIKEFHGMLETCLRERHDTIPVHNLEDLQLLMDRFPENIRIWAAYSKETDRMVGAICVFETLMCVHCQYIATTTEGRRCNALALIVDEMVDAYTGLSLKADLRYLDFGISNEEGGRLLNAGLNRQKTSYGGSGTVCLKYEINVASALESLPSELWPGR